MTNPSQPNTSKKHPQCRHWEERKRRSNPVVYGFPGSPRPFLGLAMTPLRYLDHPHD